MDIFQKMREFNFKQLILISLIILSFVITGCGKSNSTNISTRRKKTENIVPVKNAVNNYVSMVAKYNFDLAYTLLSSDVKQKWTKSDYWAKEGEKNIEKFSYKYEITNVKLSKSGQFPGAEVTLKFENGEESVLKLLQESGEWKITF